MLALQKLVNAALIEAGGSNCAKGIHRWESIGGRACPEDLPCTCSQAVYECAHCGTVDYGERGGPGHHDCQTGCNYRHLADQNKEGDEHDYRLR